MAKGYWIAHMQVHDPERYKLYVEGAAAAFREFGAKFLARGGAYEQMEGDDLGVRHVIIEFADFATAQACYNSRTYQDALRHRQAAADGRLLIVEGTE